MLRLGLLQIRCATNTHGTRLLGTSASYLKKSKFSDYVEKQNGDPARDARRTEKLIQEKTDEELDERFKKMEGLGYQSTEKITRGYDAKEERKLWDLPVDNFNNKMVKKHLKNQREAAEWDISKQQKYKGLQRFVLESQQRKLMNRKQRTDHPMERFFEKMGVPPEEQGPPAIMAALVFFAVMALMTRKWLMYFNGDMHGHTTDYEALGKEKKQKYDFTPEENENLTIIYGSLTNAKLARKPLVDFVTAGFFSQGKVPSQSEIEKYFLCPDDKDRYENVSKTLIGDHVEYPNYIERSREFMMGPLWWYRLWKDAFAMDKHLTPKNITAAYQQSEGALWMIDFVRRIRTLCDKVHDDGSHYDEDLQNKLGFKLPKYMPSQGYVCTPSYIVTGPADIQKYFSYLRMSSSAIFKVTKETHLSNKLVLEYHELDLVTKERSETHALVCELSPASKDTPAKIERVYDLYYCAPMDVYHWSVKPFIGDDSESMNALHYPLHPLFPVHPFIPLSRNWYIRHNLNGSYSSGMQVFRHKQNKWNYISYQIEQQLKVSEDLERPDTKLHSNLIKNLYTSSHRMFEWLYMYRQNHVQLSAPHDEKAFENNLLVKLRRANKLRLEELLAEQQESIFTVESQPSVEKVDE